MLYTILTMKTTFLLTPCQTKNVVQNPLIMLARIWNHLLLNIKEIEN